MQTNAGYEITRSITFDTGVGFVFAQNDTRAAPYVTWRCTEMDGRLECFWGHYHGREDVAMQDFYNRVKEYQHDYGAKIVRAEPESAMPERYRYYSTQRPVDIGTYPKSPENLPTSILNYDERQLVEDGTMRAWGELFYTKPLTKQQMYEYELKASPKNPDFKKEVDKSHKQKDNAEKHPKKHDNRDR